MDWLRNLMYLSLPIFLELDFENMIGESKGRTSAMTLVKEALQAMSVEHSVNALSTITSGLT